MINLPEPDTRKLKTAPLVLVVAQVRFGEPIETAAKSVGNALKTSLARSSRVFKLERANQQAIQMTLAASGPPQIAEPQQAQGWKLERAGTTVTVFPDAVTLETTSYSEWSDFKGDLAATLEAVQKAAAPESCQRLGLRMVNNIHGPEIETPTDFRARIEDWLLGPITNDLLAPGALASQQQHDLAIDEETRATVRAGVFPDTTSRGRMTFLLDFDVYDSEYRDYVVDELVMRAETLDHRIVQLFHASIRPEFKTELQSA